MSWREPAFSLYETFQTDLCAPHFKMSPRLLAPSPISFASHTNNIKGDAGNGEERRTLGNCELASSPLQTNFETCDSKSLFYQRKHETCECKVKKNLALRYKHLAILKAQKSRVRSHVHSQPSACINTTSSSFNHSQGAYSLT